MPLANHHPKNRTRKRANNMLKRIIAMIMIGILVLTGVAFAKGSYLGTKTVVKCDKWVTLRAKPSTSADSVARVPYGANVDAYDYNGKFTECYYNGRHGYILSKYLKGGLSRDYQHYDYGDSKEQNTDYDNYMGMKRVVKCDKWVTLRSKASTSASAVARIPLGKYVEAYKYNSKFSECYYNGMHGFVLNKYLI